MKLLQAGGLLALAALARDDTPRYAPAERAPLLRTWESRIEMDLVEWELRFDDDQEPMDALGLVSDVRLDVARKLELTDTIALLSAEQPARLERSFAEAEVRTELRVASRRQESRRKFVGESPLIGQTVVFERAEEAWKVRFADAAGGPAELLEGLEQDMDFAALLPAPGVVVGQSWEVDARALDALLRPAGALKLDPQASGEEMNFCEMLHVSPDLLFGPFEGEVKARFVAIDERKTSRLARIELKLDVHAKKDLTEIQRQARLALWAGIEIPFGGQKIPVELQEAAAEFHWIADGELVWDLLGGHMSSLALDGGLDVSYRWRETFEPDVSYWREWDHRMTFRGTLRAEIEVAEP
jgi:hypothetical protein